MLTLDNITDPIHNENRHYSALDNFFLQFIRDKRDLPFVYMTLQVTFIIIPLGILLFMPFITGWAWGVLALTYLLINTLIYKGPFGLMLHCTSHRKFFKKKYDKVNYYLPWIVAPFFGQSPETYFAHHIAMHHPENNMPTDKSSTLFYQRNSIKGFLMYFGDFILFGVLRLTHYFKDKNHLKMFWRAMLGELIFFGICGLLCLISWKAVLVVFIIPLFITRFVQMLGNWTQHAFIDSSEPDNPYKNSITCINVKYNHKCWNDGYHISHHIRPALHWTGHPHHLIDNQDEYAKNNAIIFDGLDFLGVFLCLMSKNYDKLARHFVDIGNQFNSREEIKEFLRARNQKLQPAEIPKAA
jgi:fatty acid desaturase